MNKSELYNFIKKNPSEVYLVKYNGNTVGELIHFMHYEDSFFECGVSITRCEMNTEEELIAYVKETYLEEYFDKALEQERKYWINGYLYDIDFPQCSPFLPNEIDSIEVINTKDLLEYANKTWSM